MLEISSTMRPSVTGGNRTSSGRLEGQQLDELRQRLRCRSEEVHCRNQSGWRRRAAAPQGTAGNSRQSMAERGKLNSS
jgi:hypothetical protein